MRTLIVLAVAAWCVTACSSSSSTPSLPSPGPSVTALPVATNPESLRAVAITSCGANSLHTVRISGTVHNTSARPAAFVIELSIRSRTGAALFATAAAARGVAPRSVGTWSATTTARFQPGMTCAVTGVSQR